MLLAANSVLNNGYVTLKSAFTQSFPSIDYYVTYARRRLLQMPLACVCIQFDSGISECFLTEHHPNSNYGSLQALIKRIMQKNHSTRCDPISKEAVKSLLQPLGQRSICRRSRKFVFGYIPMYNFSPVYFLYFLQALFLSDFTSRTQNKDQQVEQLYYCL